MNGTSIWANADYSAGNLCRVCGTLIEEGEVCNKHAPLLARVRARTRRLVEMAQRKRHHNKVFAWLTFERIVGRAEKMVRR